MRFSTIIIIVSVLVILFIAIMAFPTFVSWLLETEHATETVSLPGGEVIINESYLSTGFRKNIRINQLYFQANSNSPREKLCEILKQHGVEPPISLASSDLRLYRSKDRIALVLGSDVFLRRNGDYWYPSNTKPDMAAKFFLRTFLKAGDSRIRPEGKRESKFHESSDFPQPDLSYGFDQIDLDKNILVTRRQSHNGQFPEFLVYSARGYGWTWKFDPDRTREKNGFQPPTDLNLVIDFSVVMFPGERAPIVSRDAALEVPGAREIYAQTHTLSSTKWTKAEWSFATPKGTKESECFEAKFGFADPWPDYYTIFWRGTTFLWDGWLFAKIGEWVHAAGSGFVDNTRIIFIRLRRP